MITNKFGGKVKGIELTKSLLTSQDPTDLPDSLGLSVELFPASPPLTDYFLPHILVVIFRIVIGRGLLAAPCHRADKPLKLLAFIAAAWSIREGSLVVLNLIFCDSS